MGAGQAIPDWDDVRTRFDKALAAGPERVDTDQMVKLRAVGLR